jgi:hypothetical protein
MVSTVVGIGGGEGVCGEDCRMLVVSLVHDRCMGVVARWRIEN